jgi:preprotein translocase subunit SecD
MYSIKNNKIMKRIKMFIIGIIFSMIIRLFFNRAFSNKGFSILWSRTNKSNRNSG